MAVAYRQDNALDITGDEYSRAHRRIRVAIQRLHTEDPENEALEIADNDVVNSSSYLLARAEALGQYVFRLQDCLFGRDRLDDMEQSRRALEFLLHLGLVAIAMEDPDGDEEVLYELPSMCY